MRKAKLIGLLSAPVLFSTLPLFSTSCFSNDEHIVTKGRQEFTTKDEFDTWQKTGMFEGFVNNVTQWTDSNFDRSCVSNPSNDSIFKESVLNQFERNFNEYTARAAVAYSVAQLCAEDVSRLSGIQWPVILEYGLDIRYDKNDKSITGIIYSSFSCSSKVNYAYSLYMPEPLKIAAEYGNNAEDGKKHNVVILSTENGKQSVQAQTHITYSDGTIVTTTKPQSYARLDYTIFFDGSTDFKNFIGPNAENEITFSAKSAPSSETYTFSQTDFNIKSGQTYFTKDDVSFGINYDKTGSEELTSNIELSYNDSTKTWTLTNNNATKAWPEAMWLNAYIEKKTGNWPIITFKLYPST